MMLLTLQRYPHLQQWIDRVILTSPALLMAPNIFGGTGPIPRISIQRSAQLIGLLSFFTGRSPEDVTLGYPQAYRIFNPRRVRSMVHDLSFYWAYRRWVELEQQVGDPFPFQVERVGPTNQFILEMARAHQDLKALDLSQIQIPVEFIAASHDMLVDNRFTKQICEEISRCSYVEVDGYHEFIFDSPEISNIFFKALGQRHCSALLLTGTI